MVFVTKAYSAAKFGYIINDEGGRDGISYLDVSDYDESVRQELYQAVNDKNFKRGYFEKNN